MAPKMGRKTKKEVSKIDKSQTFSLDILVALGIFIAGIVIFLLLIGNKAETNTADKLVSDSETLPQRLIAADKYSATNTTIVIGNKVENDLLNKTLDRNYSDLKRELEVVSDFCVHFENEYGKLVDLDEDPCRIQYSIGDSRFNLTITEAGIERTVPCGSVEYVC